MGKSVRDQAVSEGVPPIHRRREWLVHFLPLNRMEGGTSFFSLDQGERDGNWSAAQKTRYREMGKKDPNYGPTSKKQWEQADHDPYRGGGGRKLLDLPAHPKEQKEKRIKKGDNDISASITKEKKGKVLNPPILSRGNKHREGKAGENW